MVFILNADRPHNSNEEWQLGWERYCDYLDSVRDKLPAMAYEFATASWHYDFMDPRAPHDSWLEEISIREPSAAARKEIRSLEIVVKLLGAYHNGHIELTYLNVQKYSLACGDHTRTGHGDWMYDEIRLSELDFVLHEIEWWRGGRWLIECDDVLYKWIPLDSG